MLRTRRKEIKQFQLLQLIVIVACTAIAIGSSSNSIITGVTFPTAVGKCLAESERGLVFGACFLKRANNNVGCLGLSKCQPL